MITTNLRFPKEFWEKLKEIAKKEERSANSEIIYIVKKYLEKKES